MPQPKKPSGRSCGVLLHPTSLPSPFGIGDLGPEAYRWIDLLAAAKQTWWQILPLNPTGFGDSPYQSFSAFAGNPLLVSPELLKRDGLLTDADLHGPHFPQDFVDFGPVITHKNQLLDKAFRNFLVGRATALKPAFEAFCSSQRDWLGDFALFLAVKDHHQGRSWFDWPRELRRREPAALKKIQDQLLPAYGQHQFRQFLFFSQWTRLREHARKQGIKIIGDIPIFVSSDSADVWANPELFQLDADLRPKFVAGVPPDYFCAEGQLWGNPLFDWDALKKTGYRWWIDRLKRTLTLVDLVRFDHFRGFQAFWRIPAGKPNAIVGDWIEAPGAELMETLKQSLGGLPLIAEDLGVITPEVEALRDQFQLPGMKVLQFAFGGEADNLYLPHNFVKNTVAYTGTHDNDTTWGWYRSAPEKERDHARRYLARDGHDIAWDLIRAAWSSVADTAIVPLQDVLNLGSEARMNSPGKPAGNWAWRATASKLHSHAFDGLAMMTKLYDRERV